MTNKQTNPNSDCALCSDANEDVLFEDAICRVVLVAGDEGAAFPGFCRVISQRHAREVTDLSSAARSRLMEVVFATEIAVREIQKPDKMNLASLGNVVPHVHWHVIPRWTDDSHFPAPIWAKSLREPFRRKAVDRTALQAALLRMLGNG